MMVPNGLYPIINCCWEWDPRMPCQSEGMEEHAKLTGWDPHKAYQITKMRIQFLVRQAAESDSITARKMLRFVVATELRIYRS